MFLEIFPFSFIRNFFQYVPHFLSLPVRFLEADLPFFLREEGISRLAPLFPHLVFFVLESLAIHFKKKTRILIL